MMLVCFFSNKGELEIEGKASDLLLLANSLASVENQLSLDLQIQKSDVYDGCLQKIQLNVLSGRVIVRRDSNVLTIAGSRDKLAILSENIKTLIEESDGEPDKTIQPHIHIEYFPDHFYLDSKTQPLVVSITQ